MPEVFGLLAPFMKMFRARLGLSRVQRSKAGAINAAKSPADDRPTDLRDVPITYAVLRNSDCVSGLFKWIRLRKGAFSDRLDLRLQCSAKSVQVSIHHLLWALLDQSVKCVDHDLGIANIGEATSNVSKTYVFLPVYVLRQTKPDETEHRSNLLHSLAKAVDHHVLAMIIGVQLA